MNDKDMLSLRDMLLTRRKELLDRVEKLESGWRELKPVAMELEEEAQKLSITEPFDRLEKEGREQIELIDLALRKMFTGDYGICEGCGDDISVKRLEAIPWTRLCIDCARGHERGQQPLLEPARVAASARLPDEFQDLSPGQVLEVIRDQIEQDGRIDTEELKIVLQNGIIYLEGVIASVPEHQILMQLLTDVLGFSSIVDHLAINEVFWEREDRTRDSGPSGPTAKDRLFNDQEDLTEDLFEATYQDDDTPYSPPDKPLPHQEEQPSG